MPESLKNLEPDGVSKVSAGANKTSGSAARKGSARRAALQGAVGHWQYSLANRRAAWQVLWRLLGSDRLRFAVRLQSDLQEESVLGTESVTFVAAGALDHWSR